MRGQHGHDLGEVHVAAAAEPDDTVRLKSLGPFCRLNRDFNRRLRGPLIEEVRAERSLGQGMKDPGSDPSRDQVLVRDDKHAVQLPPGQQSAQLLRRAVAEDKLSGGEEIPSRTHEWVCV
jgi:hypothetical protein